MAQDCLWMQLGRDHWWDVAVKMAVSEHGVYPQVMARGNGKSLRQMKVLTDNSSTNEELSIAMFDYQRVPPSYCGHFSKKDSDWPSNVGVPAWWFCSCNQTSQEHIQENHIIINV